MRQVESFLGASTFEPYKFARLFQLPGGSYLLGYRWSSSQFIITQAPSQVAGLCWGGLCNMYVLQFVSDFIRLLLQWRQPQLQLPFSRYCFIRVYIYLGSKFFLPLQASGISLKIIQRNFLRACETCGSECDAGFRTGSA